MARTKSSTSSASKPKVATVQGEIGTPNHSVAELQERYKLEGEKQKANYAAAAEDSIKRKLVDVTQSATVPTLSKSDKEKLRSWLTGNIFANTQNLIQASRYLYYRSPIYYKMINTYADMYCLECRQIEPKFVFSKDFDTKKALKQFEATLSFLDILNISNNMSSPLLNMWIDDVSFNLFFKDEYGSMFWRIDPSEAIIDSVYDVEGGICYGMALDMSKWKSTQRQALIEYFGSPLKEMWAEYQKNTRVKYIHVPMEYSFVLKKSYDRPDVIVPPLLPYLNQLANLNDLVDSQALADDISFYKMIYLPLKTLSAAKNSDDWEITPDLAIDYFKIAQDEAIPKGVSTAIIPGEELKTIEFSDSVSDDVNRVENSQSAILGGAGGVGALLNANKAVNNTELIKSALKSESAFVLTGVLSQIEAWTNLQLLLNVSNPCKVSYMKVTIFTKEDYRKTLLEANQYGFSYRLAYGTLLGFTERQTMAALMFETEALKLQDKMIFPLVSSYTQTGENKGEVGQGRPEKDAGDLSPSGERSRNQ